MTKRSLSAAALVMAGLMAAPEIARAETFHTCAGFIDTVPAMISTQGVWCLKHDLSTGIASGQAILVNANNITIDCNGFKIGGLPAGAGTLAYGILSVNHLNTTVRNCNVRGFAFGVDLTGDNGGGHLVEDNRLDGNTTVGIHVVGDGSVVRRNRVVDTGQSTIYAGEAIGIHTQYATDLNDNIVIGVMALPTGGGANGIGILTMDNTGGSVTGNRIRGVMSAGTGVGYGIFNSASLRLAITGNAVVGTGQADSQGIVCSNADSFAVGNVVAGWNTQIVGCLDVDNTP